VIDTSYLNELFKVPGSSEDRAIREVRERFRRAIESGSLLIVPIPCLFELVSHISDVEDGNARRRLAREVFHAVKPSIRKGMPWSITPTPAADFVVQFQAALEQFASVTHPRGFGLTDTFVVKEALRLKERYSGLGYRIHIWTKDCDLKAREPDAERNAFVG